MSDLSSGARILKYLILLFNFIFFICGIAMICVGAAISIKFHFPAHFITSTDLDLAHALSQAPIGIIVAGIIVITIVFFGCIGASRESSCLIGLFSVLLVICCIIQFGSAATIASWKKIDGSADAKIRKGFNDLITAYDVEKEVSTKSIDTIQVLMNCCGFDHPSDWKNSSTLNPTSSEIINYPKSCCGFEKEDSADCLSDMKEFHLAGCEEKFKAFVEDKASILIGCGVTIGLIQILGVIFSCLLIKQIRGAAGYEPQYNNYG